jgi:hypothetical protein
MGRVEVDAFLADSVQASGGKLHALGIGWRVLSAGALPARHDRVGIGLAVRTAPAEAGPHRLALSLIDPKGATVPFGQNPDGSERGALEAAFTSPDGDGTATLALNLDGLVFGVAGEHTFVVSVDGREVARLAFRVQTTAPPPAAEYRTGVYL